MVNKHRTARCSKQNTVTRGKGGFTIAELCVVLAIVVMVSGMIVMYSQHMNQYMNTNKIEYSFMEECAEIERELYSLIAEKDGTTYDMDNFDDRYISVSSDGKLTLPGGKMIEGLHTVGSVYFDLNEDGDMVKCTVSMAHPYSGSKSYVFALRCGDTYVDGGN